MLVLALDTTTRQGSLALRRDGALVEESVGEKARTYAERLPSDIIDLLERHTLTVGDIDLYGVAAGPGSFTGLRIGIATIQGLALVNERPVVPVSALDALAAAAVAAETAVTPQVLQRSAGDESDPTDLIAVWMDAGRQQVFSALYGWLRSRGLVSLDAPRAEEPAALLARWSARSTAGIPWRFVGDGCLTYRDRINSTRWNVSIVEPVPALASHIAVMAERAAATGETVSPAAIRPIYVRRPDAEIARDRRALEAGREA